MSAVEAASSLGRVISASSPTQTRAATQAAATSTAKRAKSRCRSPSRRIAPATIGPEDGPRVVIAETMPIVVPSLSGVETVSVRFMPIGTTMPVPRACTMRCRGPARCGDEHDDEVRGERAEDRAGQQQAQGAQEEPVRAHRAVEEAGDGHHDRGGGYAGGGDPADGARADARVVHHRGQDHVEEGLVEGGEEGRGGRPRRRSPRRRCGSCVRGHAGNSSFFVMGTHARERGRAGHGHRQGAGDGDACAGARSRGDARDGVLGTATRQWPRRRRRCAARDAARGRVHGVAGGALPGRRAGTPTRRPGRP